MSDQRDNGIRFKGTFRPYQKTVLDHADQYLADGKISIVAAPGSGKTTLGLELILRLNKPALILSPTVTIREQWGNRFETGFLPDDRELSDYYSSDIHHVKRLTSITYQALHAAYTEKSDIDLFAMIRNGGIGTLCLDEAHHLRREWQKALDAVLKEFPSLTVISLTATPPYESTAAEWEKYCNVSGVIDEEITVPELVACKNLCPHQDYIYFNYPTKEEQNIIEQYRMKAAAVAAEIMESGLIVKAVEHALNGADPAAESEALDRILQHAGKLSRVMVLYKKCGGRISRAWTKMLAPGGMLPPDGVDTRETALEYLAEDKELFSEEISDEIETRLKHAGIIEQGRVSLRTNKKINTMLLSSQGKLNSIAEIVREEGTQLKQDLRMLILTDYIRKEMLSLIGSEVPLSSMGTVPVFEMIRRNSGDVIEREGLHPGLLSGPLVLIDAQCKEQIKALAVEMNIDCSIKDLPGAPYCDVSFAGQDTRASVALMTEAFRRGMIHILVGTKALLGEGWDAPWINSLILASFVGSYMLSNQMRGRAIRIDEAHPEKTANIWHLVTVVPPSMTKEKTLLNLMDYKNNPIDDTNHIESDDFKTLSRRFEAFMGPAYSEDKIENGMNRIDILKPPYDEKGYERINAQMLLLAADRDGMRMRWERTLEKGAGKDAVPEIKVASLLPEDAMPKGVQIENLFATFALIVAECVLTRMIYASRSLPMIFVALALLPVTFYFLKRILRFLNPERTMRAMAVCLLNSLRETGDIRSASAQITSTSDVIGESIECALTHATMHEKSLFAKAFSEMMSSIEEPRYVLVRKRWFGIKGYADSYACPSILATHRDKAEILKQHFSAMIHPVDAIYTRNAADRPVLFRCRRWSKRNLHIVSVTNKKKV